MRCRHRYGEHLAKDIIAVPLGPRIQKLALGAAASYLVMWNSLSHPADLLEHDCIRLRYSSEVLIPWEFEYRGETVTINPAGRLIIGVNGASAAIDLAIRGQGIVATFENWLQPHYFETRDLVPVLPQWWSGFKGPWLYFPSRFMSIPLRPFANFLKEDGGRQAAALA